MHCHPWRVPVLFGSTESFESVMVLDDTYLFKREDFKVRIFVGTVKDNHGEKVVFRHKKAVSNIRVLDVLNLDKELRFVVQNFRAEDIERQKLD